MREMSRALALLVGLLLALPAMAAALEDAAAVRQRVARDLDLGNFRGAVKTGRAFLKSKGQQGGGAQELIPLTLQMAGAYQALGANREALDLLKGALAQVEGERDQPLRASVEAKLGGAYLLSGEYDRAHTLLAAALVSARALGLHEVAASVLNSQGNLLVLRKEYHQALAVYREGLDLGPEAKAPALMARLQANSGRAAMFAGLVTEAEGALQVARELHTALADSHDKAFGMINIAKSYEGLIPLNPGRTEAYTAEALALYGEALTVAQAIGDQAALSYAAGYLGQVYERTRQQELGLTFTDLAEAAAARAAAPESLYLWQWQGGRLLARLGRSGEAIDAYRRAVATLQAIRSEFEGECKHYNQWATKDSLEPVYLGLADLLLQQEGRTAGAKEREALLAEAIASLEFMKTQELRSYFQNTCIDEKKISFAERENIPVKTAIVYLLPLADRLELILSLPDRLQRFTVGIDKEALAALAQEFRYHLEKRTSREYLESGQQLYTTLVAPYLQEVARQGLDTLVFVPEGLLRTIPFAALHDGRGFLIDRYAVATIPSLSLTDLGQAERARLAILLAGVSESNQGFAPLSYVPDELQGIHSLYGGKVLLNQAFNAMTLRGEFEQAPYSIVHIATHGEFLENSDETFILAWDSRIGMDLLEKTMRLGRYRKTPIDLLTLSACQSAASSERAALGLAGLSLKAGVRSAVATLWYVDDQSSSDLMAEFYRRLTDPRVTKAQALQAAQRMLIADQRYRHPAYWSPFLLIGNWN